jgi:lactoylglutathione lyase
MRTLHIGLRVSDIEKSRAFYESIGYAVIGRVPETSHGSLTMLKLPGDEFVTIELVSDPEREVRRGDNLNHIVIHVDSLDATRAQLEARDVEVEEPQLPGGEAGPRTSWITDPDGNRIELVQWPDGHPAGMSADDFPTD